jgi:hypothetical protein
MTPFTPRRLRRAAGWLGLAIAAPLLAWLPLGLLPIVPSMIEVFGVLGLRTPAAIAVAGLLLAAVGFHET